MQIMMHIECSASNVMSPKILKLCGINYLDSPRWPHIFSPRHNICNIEEDTVKRKGIDISFSDEEYF